MPVNVRKYTLNTQRHRFAGSSCTIDHKQLVRSIMGPFISFIQYCQHQTLNVKILLFPKPKTVVKYQDLKSERKKKLSVDAFWVPILSVLGCPPFSSPTSVLTALSLSAKPHTASCLERKAGHQRRSEFGVTNPTPKAQISQGTVSIWFCFHLLFREYQPGWFCDCTCLCPHGHVLLIHCPKITGRS